MMLVPLALFAAGIQGGGQTEPKPGMLMQGMSMVYVLLFSWVFGTYMVWMHNSSLVDTEVKNIGSLPARHTDANELDEAATGAYKVK